MLSDYNYLNAVRPKYRIFFAFLLGCLLFAPWHKAQAATPTVTTGAASAVAAANATLNGTVVPNGLNSSAFFQWGSTAGYGSTTGATAISAATPSATITANLTGLAPLGVYHYRVVSTNRDGLAYGADQTFVTVAPAPSVTTRAATGLGTTYATLNGLVVPYGAMVYFQWGLTTAYGNTTPAYILSGGSISWNDFLTGLTPGTIYHYRLIAANSGGATYGADVTFSTTTARPTATTDPASGVTQTSAVLNGDVNPNGQPATVYFQWGRSSAYGNVTANLMIGSGYNDDYISANLPGLLPYTQYHFRVIATNGAGSVAGLDQTFFTRPLLPEVITSAANGINGAAAILNGAVNPNGYLASYYFLWGQTAAYGNRSPLTAIGSGNNYTPVTFGLATLLPVTTYHFQLWASNTSGLNAGVDQSFTTTGPSPSVTTGLPNRVGETTAQLSGSADPNGLPGSAYFRWGVNTNYNNLSAATSIGTGSSPVPLTDNLASLVPRVTYHYDIVAFGGGGSAYGADQMFTTIAEAPNVLTLPATNILQTTALLQGDVDANGLPTYFYFQYGTNTNYGISTPIQSAGNGILTNLWTYQAFGLSSYTVYHYRIVATNLGGTTLGNDVVFNTHAPSPSVTTLSVGTTTSTTVVLNGEVNPYNLRATNWFEWGPTINYGNFTPSNIVSSDSLVTSTLNGLAPSTLYHYRVRASSIGGVGTGDDESFTTSPLTAVVRSVSQDGNRINFQWDSTAGQSYQVQFKSSLDETNWSDLTRITATNGVTTGSDEISPVTHRIYRVITAP